MKSRSGRAQSRAVLSVCQRSSRRARLLASAAGATILASSAYAADTNWTAGALSPDWFTAGNWSAGVPTAADNANITAVSSNSVIIGAAGAVAANLNLEQPANYLTVNSGGTLDVSGTMQVGQATNFGTFTINAGGVATIATLNADSLVLVAGSGAVLNTTDFSIGTNFTSQVRLESGGVINVDGGAGTLTLGAGLSSGGLSIGGGLPAGTLNAATVHMATDNSQIGFSQAGSTTFAADITGLGSIVTGNPGTTILTGTNTYSGTTTISVSTLQIGNGGTTGTLGTGNVSNDGALVFNRSNSLTVDNVISGSGTLTKQGAGTLTLTGANTYSGGTTISAGTLEIGGTAGSIAGNVTNDAALTFNRVGDLTYTGVISGAGTVTKLGAGTLTLTGDHTYTGTTFINEGTVSVGSGGTTGSIVGDVVLDGDGWLYFDRSNNLTYAGVMSGPAGTGKVVKASAGTLTLTGNSTYTGQMDVAQGTVQIGNSGTSGAFAGDIYIYDGATLVFNRSDNATYSGALEGTGALTKLGAGTLTLTGSNASGALITISEGTLQLGNGGAGGALSDTTIVNNAALAFNLSNNTFYSQGISGTGSVTLLGAGTVVLAGPNTYSGGTTISNGTLQIGNGSLFGSIAGNIVDNAVLIFDRSNDLTYSGVISGTGTVIKHGAGVLTLGGANTFSGGINVAEGTLRLANDSAAGTGAITTTGSVIDYANGVTIANPIMLNSNDTQLQVTTGTATQAGIISDAGGSRPLEKIGAGTLVLTAANTYTGVTTISAGTLQVGNGGTTGSVAGDIVDNAALVFNRSNNLTYAGVISGTGTVTKSGSGTLTLTAPNSYSGDTVITAGTLELGNGGVSGYIGGDIVNNGTLAVNLSSGGQNFDQVISGTGAFEHRGTGVTYLTGANTYAGGTTITAGTLVIGDFGTTGSIVGDVLDNGILAFARTDTITFNGAVSGTGGVDQRASGTLILTGSNSYSGQTRIFSGTLQIGNGGTSGSLGSGAVVNEGALVVNRLGDLTYSGAISGTGTVTKLGAGTLTLTGANTYTGVTTISAGALQIGNGGTTGSVAGNIVDNAALVFNRSNDTTYAGVISGTGTVTKAGDGILTLSADQTYTGGTTVNDGAIVLGAGASLAAGSDLTVNGACQTTNLCGIFDLNGNDQTIGDLSGTGGIVRVSNATLTVGTSDPTSFAGNISEAVAGTSALIKQGSGTLTLTGTTVVDTITVSAGTLRISDGGSASLLAGDVTGDIANNAALVFDGTGSQDVTGNVSGTGTLTKLGSGTLTLHAVNTYTGDTTITGGTLIVTDSLTSDVTNNAQLRFHPAVGSTLTYDGIISGTGFLTKFDGGTLELTAPQTYSGGTTIEAGTLQLVAGGALPTGGALTMIGGTFNLNDNDQTIGDLSGTAGNITLGSGTLTVGTSASTTFGGVISGTGGLVKQGSGTLTLTLAQTYTGGTTINAGTLKIGDGGTSGSIPGNIVNNGTLAFDRSGLIYGGVISGTGSLTKSGTGTVTLTGANTYTGATVINGGILLVNGSIGSSAVTVNDGGTLGGTGTVGGTTIGAGGTLSPGNSIGTITVNGNLSFNSSADYIVEVSPTDADRTDVIGSATLAGTMSLVPTGGTYTLGTEYTVLNATGGVSGTFDVPTTLFSSAIRGTVIYDAHNVFLRLDPNALTPLLPDSLGENELQVASAVDVILANASSVPGELLSLFNLSSSEVGPALSELSGEIGVGATQGQFQSLLQYLTLLLDENPGGRARLAPMRATAMGNLSVWAALQADHTSISGSASEGSHDLDSEGGQFVLGLDFVRPAGVLGISAAIGRRDYDVEGLGSASDDTFQAGLHSRVQFDQFYVSGSGAFASFDVSTDRTIAFTGGDQYAGDFTAHGFGGRVEAGRPFATAWGALTPFANLSAERITTPDYDESTTNGSDELALHHDDEESDRARLELGAEVATRVNTTGGVSANLRVAWAHEFIRDHSARASFQGFPGTFFEVRGARLDADVAVVGAGLSAYLGDRTALRFNVAGEFGSRSESYSGFIGLHTSW